MSAALTAFQPGDRVVSYGTVLSVGPRFVEIAFEGDGGDTVRLFVAAAKPLPTAPAQLRAMAELVDATLTAFPTQEERQVISFLRAMADRLESASAPKPPPTLAEAVDAYTVVLNSGRSDVGKEYAAMVEALAREGAAK